jgi:hypothetical protein
MSNHLNSYPSIYALGHRAVADILLTPVVVEEKIDGSQFSMARINGELVCRSKGQHLTIGAPEKMFALGVETAAALDLRDGWTYRGEYLNTPKHNTLAYARTPIRNVIIFDVMTAPETYLPPAEKAAECERIGLECVPVLFEGLAKDLTSIAALIDAPSVLGGVPMEGAVIKNYNLFTADKKIAIAKVVSDSFKEKHGADWASRNPTQRDVVEILIAELKTEARWNKAIQHLRDEGRLAGEPKDIGPLLKELQADTAKEEAEYIKERLFKQFWPQILRGINYGFPEFYKAALAAQTNLTQQ